MKNILVIGGAGYTGGVVVPLLIENGWNVKIYDTFWYGDKHLPKSDRLTLYKGDVRDIENFKKTLSDVEYVLHLACVSNDASFELDTKLSQSVNYDSFEPIVQSCKNHGVKRFVFASTSSVYGISDAKEIKEDHPLVPITDYNKLKGMCEPILLKYTDDNFTGVIFRPATVCGYSPRQRLDLSVNILTNFAINKNKIIVYGGNQLRPNLHIKDYADLCLLLLNSPSSKINNQIYNVGMQNLKIIDIAYIVKKVVEEFYKVKNLSLEIQESNDQRSYHINSDKIKNHLNFTPKFRIEDAVIDLCNAFKSNKLPNSFDDDIYFNVKRMKNLKIK